LIAAAIAALAVGVFRGLQAHPGFPGRGPQARRRHQTDQLEGRRTGREVFAKVVARI